MRDVLHLVALICSSHTSLAAENLFLRKQLAFYLERKVWPRRLDDASRIAVVSAARVIDCDRSSLSCGPIRESGGIVRDPPVLAVEVTATWSPPDSCRRAGRDRHDGASELDLG